MQRMKVKEKRRQREMDAMLKSGRDVRVSGRDFRSSQGLKQ